MNTWKVKKNSGFTIIELMIVVLIVAILVALAYPSYVQYVRKAKRGEALQLLMNWSINQEIWRSNHTLYASVSIDPDVGMPAPTNENYTFSTIGTLDAATYTLQAAAQNDQVNDVSRDGTECKFLTLDQIGLKDPTTCWD